MARNQGSCSARPRGWGWEWSRGGAPRPGSPAHSASGAGARSRQRGRREGWKGAATQGLLRSRPPGPEGTCSLLRPLPESCAGGWTRSGDADDNSSSSSEDWSAGSHSSSHASSDTMDLSFMAAQVTRNLPHAPRVSKFAGPQPRCPPRCSSSVPGQVLCPEPGSPTWCTYPGPPAWLSRVKWPVSLAHRRWSGVVSTEHPTSEQDSSEGPGQRESPLPAQPPLAVCGGAPRAGRGQAGKELPSPLWFCLVLALCHLLVSSGQPPFSPLWVVL